jgi:3,4-dihydroxy 2-butanone 4-phosphate synthase/GTP cyclohydrolase II
VVTVADLIQHRLQHEPLVVREAASQLQTEFGTFDITIYRSLVDGATHAALTLGAIDARPTLVRVHRGNLLPDAFGFVLSSARRNLQGAFEAIAREGRGVLLYLDAGRDADDLAAALQSYVDRAAGQPRPATGAMALHEFGIGAQILRDLGCRQLRVLTNQPLRLRGVGGYGLEIVEWLPVPTQGSAP